MIEVSIVSGTYNRLPLLKKMIYSVRTSVRGLSYEIILVDGGSTDGTQAWAKAQPDVKLIEHGKLYGAIKAYNDGAAAARGEYVVFANDDLTFVDDALTRALAFMYSQPGTGIGLFQTNRSRRGWHHAEMPAHYPDGTMLSVPYNGVIIAARWLGNQLGWWSLPGARTYGGDCAFVARCMEAGWPVVPLEGIRVDEPHVEDALKRVNVVPSGEDHPDTTAYLKRWPHGPELGRPRQFEAPPAARRILYAPIYEERHQVQHEQKRGLRRALQRIGIVREIDYIALGAETILQVAQAFQPDLVLTQCHYAEPFTPDHAVRLRDLLPRATIVNWNGDVYDRSDNAPYVQMLKTFDLQTVVNASAVANYQKKGVRAAYWQIGYEPDGVGHAPDAGTPRHDVIFLGNGYREERHVFGGFIRSLPYRTAIYGDFWPQGWAYPTTLYDFKQGCRLYQNARIALGDSDWSKEGGRGFVSNRPFQAMVAGGCLMMQQQFDGCEELLGLVDGKHLVLWRDHDDLRAKLAYYLDPVHEAERAEIARAGQLEALRAHSFEARVAQLLDILKRIDNMVPGIDPHLIGVHYA